MIVLQRNKQNQYGTFGSLSLNGKFLCYTLEEPWRGNQRKISCIPPGIYDCVPHSSGRFQNVWRLLNVKGRDAILIHAGNTTADTEGCILVGMRLFETGIGESRKALDMLRETLPGQFKLEVRNS